MPIFTSPDALKDHKGGYVPLLKKALLTVKPESQKKFLYFKHFAFGAKKLPLVVVDYDPKFQAALAKSGVLPTAEGTVSLTTTDELNFEPKKGAMKRIGVQKYFATLGGGIKPVFVPPGEVDDEESPSTPPTTIKQMPTKEPAESEKILSRIDQLRGTSFPPALDKLKSTALDKARALADAGKLAEATMLLDQLATKAAAPALDEGTIVKGAFNLGALKWTRWFREKPLWPELLTKTAWDKNKSTLAKMTLSTGVGEQLKVCEAAFASAVAKMPIFAAATSEQAAKSKSDCEAFMGDSSVKNLHESLKALRDIANNAAAECKKSLLIPKATTQLCTDIANAADALMVGCNPNTLSGSLAEAVKAGDAAAANDAKTLNDLKAEKDLLKRIALAEKLLEQNPGGWPPRDAVETLLAEAKKEWGVSQAKAAYATQMKGEVHEGDADTPAYNPGGKFDPKNLQQKDMIFQDAKVKQLMKDTGLTEGEVLAIRAYTASNYKYINPAIANQKDRVDKEKDWMDIQNRPDPSKAKNATEKKELEKALKKYNEGKADAEGSKKGLYEEGALHAGMITEAFKKLPVKKGKLYRGARMTPKAFKDTYAKGKEFTYEAFVSQTTAPDVARGFANGGGDFAPPDDATTSVFVEAQITNARDLTALSVYGAGEAEWLLPPGTKLRVKDISDDPKKDAGRPPAKDWKIVVLEQV